MKNHHQVCKVISEGELEKDAEPSWTWLEHNACNRASLP